MGIFSMSSIPCVTYDKGFIFKNIIFIRKSLKQAVRKKNPTKGVSFKIYNAVSIGTVIKIIADIDGRIVNRLDRGRRWSGRGCGMVVCGFFL